MLCHAGWYVGSNFSEEYAASIFMALQWERYKGTNVLGEIFFKNTEDRGRNLSRNGGICITTYTA
jgi:hypothetical protein